MDSVTERTIQREFMDASVRPCDDFYTYANGGWLAKTKIPDDQPAWGGFAELNERNQNTLHEILEEAARGESSDPNVRMVGDLYASGMDEAAIASAGLAGVAPLLARIDALTTVAELPRVVGMLQTLRVGAPFSMAVQPDAFDSERHLIHIGQGGLGLPDRDSYLRTDAKSVELQERYRAHVATMLGLLGATPERASADAATIYGLEHALAEASMPRAEQRDPYKVNNPFTRAQLDARTPAFDWGAFLAEIDAADAHEFNVRQPAFLTALDGLIRGRPLETWRTYLRWHLVRSLAPYLPRAFERASFDFFGTALVGQPEEKPRWKRVLGVVDAQLPHPLGRLYVDRAFPPQAKQRILDLVADLRAVLAERIATLEWMSEETRRAARVKLDAFGVKMGYPDAWRDFGALRIDRGPYVDNVMRAIRFTFAYDIAKLGKPVDRGEWLMSPPTVNAYYNPPRNEIVFPAGILQPPFFFAEGDAAVNYGAIGMVIGHEMTHGFDDSGSQFDASGNLRDWWQPADREAYDARTELVVRQYEEYEPLPGMRINGKLCLGENIADLGGLKVAYAAFERYLAAHGEPAPIDGFTARQRFFLGYAQAWRNLMRDELLRVRLSVDPHSPPRYRVVAPLANLPEFFAAFGCDGGAMARAPELRPAIW
ncbi:MAG TPA: M13 family metallopeptidase [Candidatus Limnocylindria bacterium]|nr:M13 family metallopeptidase [Candidatus Limnocylindria bacterium]